MLCPHVKEGSLNLTLYNGQKSTQNGLRSKCKTNTSREKKQQHKRKLRDIRFGSEFLDMTTKAQAATKKGEQGYTKTYTLLCDKGNNTVKTLPMEWEKQSQIIFTEGLISRIYKDPI